MAVPVTWDPTTPASGDAASSGDDQLRDLLQGVVDLLGFRTPASTNDWRIVSFRADPGFMRTKDTGASGVDTRLMNMGGRIQYQENTGTEAAPIWTTRVYLDHQTLVLMGRR